MQNLPNVKFHIYPEHTTSNRLNYQRFFSHYIITIIMTIRIVRDIMKSNGTCTCIY